MAEEQQVEEQTPSEEMSETEATARDNGWRPKDEWEGDPDLWVTAAQFNVRGELMNRIKTQTRQIHKQDKEIADLKQGFSEFQEHAQKVAKAEYEAQLKQLKDVKKQALEDQNYDLVVEADDKMAELKESQKEQPKQQEQSNPESDPEIAAWLEENQWYKEDAVMAGAADSVANEVRRENPNAAPREVLDEVAKRVKARFEQTPQKGANNPMTPQSQGRKPAKRGFGKADLNEEQLAVGKRLVRAGALKDLKEYATQLHEIGEL